jgi:hypothetical protein
MRPPKLILPALSLALISLLAPPTTLDAQTKPPPRVTSPPGVPVVIFAVKKYDAAVPVQMEPVVIISGGKYTPPPLDDEAGAKKFTDNYFRPGRTYSVIFGGGQAGNLSVVKNVEPGCVGITAEVQAQTSVRLGGAVQALATGSDKIGAGEGSRRAPTEAERAAALEVARAVYGQRGVGAALVNKMKTENLTATDLDRDGKFDLVGSFQIDAGNYLMHNLFVIFEPLAGGKYKAAWNWYHKGAEGEYEDRKLVDAVDLDGDGTAEVVAEGHYYESNDYVIYKRQAGVWKPIYKGGGGGC